VRGSLPYASSGKTNRHRLNRGGDRDANRDPYLVAVGRMGWDPATRAYVERSTTEGLSKKDLLRRLKRYIARELYPLLAGNPAAACAQAALLSGHTSVGPRVMPAAASPPGLDNLYKHR
jgi:hypothetical protein